MAVPQPHPSTLEAGTLVGVAGAHGHATGFHLGVVSGRLDEYDLPLVIAPSHRTGRVQEEAWLAFTEGKEARVFAANGGRGAVLARGRALIGERAVGADRCDQFSSAVQGESGSGAGAALAGAAIGLAVVAVIAGALMLLVDDAEGQAPARPRRAATG